MDYQVVIPAAGTGKRMNVKMNKQLIELNSIPVIIHTLMVFEQDIQCNGIVLVINAAERDKFLSLLKRYQISKIISVVDGGATRQQSVWNGLKKINNTEIILIHDGARPFIKTAMIHELVEATAEKGAAVVAVPVKDTIKRVRNFQVIDTIERSSLWAIQTPQAFHVPLIMRAHREAEIDRFLGTDDASLVERIGVDVAIIRGDYQNIKLTTPEDLLFAQKILENWKIH